MIFHEFLKNGRWPKYAYVDDELYAHDHEIEPILQSLPRRFFHPDRRGIGGLWIDENEALSLTVLGVACCEGSKRVLERFLQGVSWGVAERRKARTTSSMEVPDPSWRFADFVAGVRLPGEVGDVPFHEVKLVLCLMEHERDLIRWSGPPEDPLQWVIKIPREIRRYAKLGSFADFLSIAYPSVEEQEAPSVPNPLVNPVLVARPTDFGGDVSSVRDSPAGLEALHESFRAHVEPLLVGGHHDHAIFEAFKILNNRVKAMTGLDADGQALMGKAMSPKRPLVRFNEGRTQTDLDEQQGLMHIFMGAMGAFRNPRAHEHLATEREEALEHLALASLLMRKLDSAAVEIESKI